MISEIEMNLYVWSYSIDESDREEFSEYSKKCYIGCMAAYTSGNYVYLNNITDHPERHYIGFVLNQRHGMYIA